MKKIFTLTCLMAIALNINAQVMKIYNGTELVATYTNSEANKVVFEDSSSEIPIKNITLNAKSIIMNVGNVTTLIPTIFPNNATESVIWTSSNKNVATVLNGVITPKSVGTTTITVQSVTGASASCIARVIDNLSQLAYETTTTQTFEFNADAGQTLSFAWDAPIYSVIRYDNTSGVYKLFRGYFYVDILSKGSTTATSLVNQTGPSFSSTKIGDKRTQSYNGTNSYSIPSSGTYVLKMTVNQATANITNLNLSPYSYVDLGLPSGTLWATCNIGASMPEEYGDYFAWGETQTKSNFNINSYKHYNAIEYMTKYCKNSSYGIVDNKTVLDSIDDVATQNWGKEWRMPTYNELKELFDSKNTTCEWTIRNGINGRLFTSKTNGNSIFLPAAGSKQNYTVNNSNTKGEYWSSSLGASSGDSAWRLDFSLDDIHTGDMSSRSNGKSIRPVRAK